MPHVLYHNYMPHVQLMSNSCLNLYTLFLVSIMDYTSGLTEPPAKKRRTRKGRLTIRDGDEITADGVISHKVTMQTDTGPLQVMSSRAVWLDREDPPPAHREGPTPTEPHRHLYDDNLYPNHPDGPDGLDSEPLGPVKTQHYYLQEFVKRVNPLMDALLSREIPEGTVCAQCADGCRELFTVPHFVRPESGGL
jgi:hypothetical protein